MTPDAIIETLRDHAGELATFLYPGATQKGTDFHADKIIIHTAGLKRGTWTQPDGTNNRSLAHLIATKRGYTNDTDWQAKALNEASAWLEASMPGQVSPASQQTNGANGHHQEPKPEQAKRTGDRTADRSQRPAARINYPQDFHREMPQAADSEKAVLACLAMHPKDTFAVCSAANLDASAFYIPSHAELYATIARFITTAKPLDFITLIKDLTDRGRLDQVGGPALISALWTDLPTAVNAKSYVDAVVDAARRRALLQGLAGISARAYDPHEPLADLQDAAARVLEAVAKSAPAPRQLLPLMDIATGDPNPRATVLGHRFLCLGGACLFVGPSGIGKSSASVQQDILWALGRPAFGIRPARPLKILTIQAENDAEDLAEMREGVCKGLGLTQRERDTVRANVFYESECGLTGEKFLRFADERLARNQFDLFRTDPLMAYQGSDVNDAEATAAFLRAGLNPILAKHQVAAIVNHHTPKAVNRDTSNWRGSDWMYAGAGSADITNWARAILVIDPTHVPHIFRFIAAKRGGRIGWVNEDGEKEFERPFCHASDGGLYWRDATDADAAQLEGELESRNGGPRKTPKTQDDVRRLLPIKGAIGINELLSLAGNSGIGEKKTRRFLACLVQKGEAFQHRPIKDPARPKNQEWRYGRQPEELP